MERFLEQSQYTDLTNSSSFLTGDISEYEYLADILRSMNLSQFGNESDHELLYNLIKQIQQKVDSEQDASVLIYNLLTFVPPLILAFGIVGNILSFIVLTKFSKRFPSYHYLYVLASLDMVVLLTGLLRLWVKQITGNDVASESNFLCPLFTFLGFFSSVASVWIVLAISIDRAIAIKYPLKRYKEDVNKRTKLIILIILIGSGLVNIHFLFTMGLQPNKSHDLTSSCDPHLMYLNFYRTVWAWIDAIIYSWIPFCVIGITNIFTIIGLFIARKTRKSLNSKEVKVSHREHYMTIMVLTISISVLIMLVPVNTIMIMLIFWKNTVGSNQELYSMQVAKTIGELLMYTSHSVNFVLYYWAGSQFRHQFGKVFFPKKKEKRVHRMSTFEPTCSKSILSIDDDL
ncbi:FMRFamide receptor-like [Mytilus trossulus]|uniref:FMRFamide receptor-like n=1 Tax=Mytilus trossulus TaxID=6551 RepID=UPI0030041C92